MRGRPVRKGWAGVVGIRVGRVGKGKFPLKFTAESTIVIASMYGDCIANRESQVPNLR